MTEIPTPVAVARAKFETHLGASPGSAARSAAQSCWLQGRLAVWQYTNFSPAATAEHLALGVCEEAGELAHAVLKGAQKIRGYDYESKYLAAVGDALANIAIYSMQLATLLRLDWRTLVEATAEKVMLRDWRKDPVGADKEPTP